MPRCKLQGCPVAIDGRCLENLGGECPNLLSDDGVAVDLPPSVDSEEVRIPTSAFEPLSPAVPLEVAQARRYSQRGLARVISFVGMRECGKTSLLARIHQLFQSGPIGDFAFAGSASLPRLEEMNWLAAVQSGLGQPQMDRSSSRFDNAFLHLEVLLRTSSVRIDMLFNDISGETFERAVSSQSICDNLIVLRRANHVVVLIDGALMATHQRHHHLAQIHDFLQRAIQGGHLHSHTIVHVVTSKMDCLPPNRLSTIDDAESALRNRLEPVVNAVYTWRIAARPMDGTLPTELPIVDMFTHWASSAIASPPAIMLPPLRQGRPICRFGFMNLP